MGSLSTFAALLSVTFKNFLFMSFGWQVEILAKEYLRSLTEPEEKPESEESAGPEDTCVSLC